MAIISSTIERRSTEFSHNSEALQQQCAELRQLIEHHQRYTGSAVAEAVLSNFDTELPRFVKVMPTDYKRVLMQREAAAGITAAAN